MTGAFVRSVPNPAVNEDFSGTGLSVNPLDLGELVVGGASGNWWRLDSTSGVVQAMGNNGIAMFGLYVRGLSFFN